LTISPEGGYNSFAVTFDVNLNITPEITLHHRNILFHTAYQFQHFVWFNDKMTRNKMNAVTDYSYLQWQHDNQKLMFGRMTSASEGRLQDLLLSPTAPTLDQLYYQLTYKKFKIDYRVGQLDNRSELTNDGKWVIYHRYFYQRKLYFGITQGLQFTFQEFIVSTGVGRNIEFYYLTPMGLLFAEEIHEEPQNVRDSDNGFLGFGIDYKLGNQRYYNEWVVDEFQIDAQDARHRQNIFGMIAGLSGSVKGLQYILEYAYASPWLYLHSGVVTTPEKHGLPLGLRTPQSQSVELSVKYRYSDLIETSVIVYESWMGDQNLTTDYEPYDNKIDYFSFKHRSPTEFRAKVQWLGDGLNPYLAIYHNWLNTGRTDYLIGFSYGINL